MKKLILLFMFFINALCFSNIEKGKIVEIDIVGEVLSSVTINKKHDLNFGNITVGMKAVTSTTGEAVLEICGELEENVLLKWKGNDEKWKNISENIEVNLMKKNECIVANISLVDNLSEIKGNQEIRFKGNIDRVPEVSSGEYIGKFVVRVMPK